MLITKEYLEAERARLQEHHAQLVAQANAATGAIEILSALIVKCDEQEQPAQTSDAP
jgi:hypothetical protein